MRQLCTVHVAFAVFAPAAVAQQDGPYKVLRTARVGGEGGWDYIYADSIGRRLYIPRGSTHAVAVTGTTPEVAAVGARLTIFDLDTLKPIGEITGVGGNGTAVDPESGHGFTSDHPKVSMFDSKTMTLIKSIDVGAARPDGIYFDPFNCVVNRHRFQLTCTEWARRSGSDCDGYSWWNKERAARKFVCSAASLDQRYGSGLSDIVRPDLMAY